MKTNLRKNPINFLLGADPELVVLRGNTIVGERRKEGDFGLDGMENKIHEVRPAPSDNPLIIVDNIKSIFQEKIHQCPTYGKYKWIAGSYAHQKPLGGHVHTSINSKIIHPKTLCTFLDQYLGSLLILLEDRREGYLRRHHNGGVYGQLSSYRVKNHGMEWRSPSSWLVSPKIASAVLCASKVICHEVLNNKSFEGTNFITNNDILEMNQDKIFRKFPKIWSEITKMQLYPKYKSELKILQYLIIRKKNWYPDITNKGEIKFAWGLSIPKIETKKKIIIPKEKKKIGDLWVDRVIEHIARNERFLARNVLLR